MVSTRFCNRFEPSFGPRQIVFSSLCVACFKTEQPSFHSQSTLKGKISSIRVPNNSQRSFNRFTEMCIAEPSSSYQSKHRFFAGAQVGLHGLKQFGCIHEECRFGQRKPRWPVQLILPRHQRVRINGSFSPPARNNGSRSFRGLDDGHGLSSFRSVLATASIKAVSAAMG